MPPARCPDPQLLRRVPLTGSELERLAYRSSEMASFRTRAPQLYDFPTPSQDEAARLGRARSEWTRLTSAGFVVLRRISGVGPELAWQFRVSSRSAPGVIVRAAVHLSTGDHQRNRHRSFADGQTQPTSGAVMSRHTCLCEDSAGY
jgi:hypothetical protein